MTQITFKTDKILYLIATPIGNMKEVSERAKEIINDSDIIACEDSRVTGLLLNKLGFKKKMIPYHAHNEGREVERIIELIEEGKKVALVSDAGYPLINDPGQVLVEKAVARGISVSAVNGPSAFLHGLVVSGLDTTKFTYNGYIPSQKTKRQAFFRAISEQEATQICYETPHRIIDSLRDALDIMGDRRACVARELTKLHETIYRGNISELIDKVKEKGEFVVIFEGKQATESTEEDVVRLINIYKDKGMRDKEIAKQVASETSFNKNAIYEIVLSLK